MDTTTVTVMFALIGIVIGQGINWLNAKNIARVNRETQRLIELDKFRRDTRSRVARPIVDMVHDRLVKYTEIYTDMASYDLEDRAATKVKIVVPLIRIDELSKKHHYMSSLLLAQFAGINQINKLIDADRDTRLSIKDWIELVVTEEELVWGEISSADKKIVSNIAGFEVAFREFVSVTVESYIYGE